MAKWRETVKPSIKNGESLYVRDTLYDRLIGLLLLPLLGEVCPRNGKLREKPLYFLETLQNRPLLLSSVAAFAETTSYSENI